MKTLHYLGPAGTNTEKAAARFAASLDDCVLQPASNIVELITRVHQSQGQDYGAVPYYNYLEGLVQQNLDLLYEKKLNIVDALRLNITHCLGGYPETMETTCVYSHPAALAQCTEYLHAHYPGAVPVPVSSTSEGARRVAEEQHGLAIANLEALESYNVPVVANDIGNRRHGRRNFTDFYLVCGQSSELRRTEGEWLTMVAITPHCNRAGLLSQILAHVAFFGINNAKIHSRPALDFVTVEVDPQMFYLEMMCHATDEHFQACIRALEFALNPERKNVEVVRVLGSYADLMEQKS